MTYKRSMAVPKHLYEAIDSAMRESVQDIGPGRLATYYKSLPTSDRPPKDIRKRFRWDLWWAIPAGKRYELMDQLYSLGLNDGHLDTVLKSVTSETLECASA